MVAPIESRASGPLRDRAPRLLDRRVSTKYQKRTLAARKGVKDVLRDVEPALAIPGTLAQHPILYQPRNGESGRLVAPTGQSSSRLHADDRIARELLEQERSRRLGTRPHPLNSGGLDVCDALLKPSGALTSETCRNGEIAQRLVCRVREHSAPSLGGIEPIRGQVADIALLVRCQDKRDGRHTG